MRSFILASLIGVGILLAEVSPSQAYWHRRWYGPRYYSSYYYAPPAYSYYYGPGYGAYYYSPGYAYSSYYYAPAYGWYRPGYAYDNPIPNWLQNPYWR